MFKKVKDWTDRHRSALIIASLIIIMIIYLGCICKWDWEDILYYIYPETTIKGLMLVCAYLAWRSYQKETAPTLVCMLFTILTVILPFVTDNDRGEMLLAFCWCLWPVLVVYFVNRGMQKILQNTTLVFGIDMSVILLLSVVFHQLAQINGENKKLDFCIPIMWLVQGLIWTIIFCFVKKAEKRKRAVVIAWLGCMLFFMFFTYIEISYFSPSSIWREVRGRYWNEVIFLAWPVLLLFLWKGIGVLFIKGKSCYVQKTSMIYFMAVLSLIYVITRLDFNWGVSCFLYDIAKILYCLLLAELVLWKELYQKQKTVCSRCKSILFMALLNISIFMGLLIKNERLQDIVHNMSAPPVCSSQVDWIAYRKSTFCAFITRDLSVLNELYKEEAYWKVLDGHGIAAIRFDVGILPVLLMVFFVVIIVVLLRNWKKGDESLNHYAGYLAVSYVLKMGIAVFLQAHLIVSMRLEFPFTGQDFAEGIVLGLLLCAEGRVMGLQKAGTFFQPFMKYLECDDFGIQIDT